MTTARGPRTLAGKLCAVLTFFSSVAIVTVAAPPAHGSSSSPLRANGSTVSSSSTRPLSPGIQSLTETATFAADCTTPKITFNLGETVCAKAAGLTGFRMQWVDPDGFAIVTTDISNDPQSGTFALPSTDQSAIGGFFIANNLGRWRVNAITTRNSVNTAAFFTVKDPAHPAVDLSIVKTLIGSDVPGAGTAVQFAVTIVNHGPDDAPNTHFVDNTFTNATFDSLSQTEGPAFTCSGADCQIASFPNGAVATFVLDFTVGSGGALIENSASVSSDIADLNPADNSSTSNSTISSGSGPPPTCDLVVTAPAAVTLYTGPGATSCEVFVNDLDTTLGTATATDTCELIGGATRSGVPSGNNFPVGTTTVTYAATDTLDNNASATQLVTVVDTTPPTIACPPDIALEPTCPSGAVARWTEPAGADNCSGPTTTQNTGPANGAVFPIGTTQVSYAVSDAAGNQAGCAFSVTVLTVQAALENLQTAVNASSLNGPQKQGLLPKLDASLAAFNRGDLKAACNQLSAFINSVQNQVAHGNVPAAQGQAWINSAMHVSNAIGCTSNPCM